jgi:hypothetical protein
MTDLSKILSISGKRGLFKVVSQLKNAVLVESLIDQKRFPAFAHEKISTLEEISVFTTGEDIQLKNVLKTMFEKLESKPAIDTKTDDNALKSFFLTIVPDYDPDRVYASDIKKIIGWYNLLVENKLIDFTEKEEEKKESEPGSGDENKTGAESGIDKPEPAVKKTRVRKTVPKNIEKTSKSKKPASQSRSKKSEG